VPALETRGAVVASRQTRRSQLPERTAPETTASPEPIELTILMPCLNEAETLAVCIRKAQQFLAASGIAGEVLVADNGSTDGSRQIANAMGARMVPVGRRGYGAALIGGIAAARGGCIVMGGLVFSAAVVFFEPRKTNDSDPGARQFLAGEQVLRR
jgi:hypothetical protein